MGKRKTLPPPSGGPAARTESAGVRMWQRHAAKASGGPDAPPEGSAPRDDSAGRPATGRRRRPASITASVDTPPAAATAAPPRTPRTRRTAAASSVAHVAETDAAVRPPVHE